MSGFNVFGDSSSTGDVSRKAPDWSSLRDPETYVPDPALVDAVNVALALGQPLLLAGEAGTGKTLLAYHLASQLGLAKPLKFDTKSTSEARDLFYTYNALARFQAAQTNQGSSDTLDYLDFNALGLAILKANPPDKYAELRRGPETAASDRRSMVLIDEVDKAPRDFPNDILHEIEHMSFRIPELGNMEVSSSKEQTPIVILTSNSEKNLPDAFLRRCVFYYIPFPARDRLEIIVQAKLQRLGVNDEFLNTAMDLFLFLRSSTTGLTKNPATAELLGWLISLRNRYPEDANPLAKSNEEIASTMGALLKTVDDQKRTMSLLERWRGK